MEKQHYKNSAGYSLVEMLAVLLIVSIIIIILSKTSVANYNKYKERLALNELVSDLYQLQTRSLNEENIYIDLFSSDGEYVMHYSNQNYWKKISNDGKVLLSRPNVRFKYREGNLVSKANTVDVKFSESLYRLIVHLDTGYITVDEIE